MLRQCVECAGPGMQAAQKFVSCGVRWVCAKGVSGAVECEFVSCHEPS